MSKKRTFLKILSAAVLALSVIMLALTAFTCILLYSSGGKTFTLFGNRYAAVEMTGDPGYPRGSLIRLQQGSIPENTPVAVDAGGIAGWTTRPSTASRSPSPGGGSWGRSTGACPGPGSSSAGCRPGLGWPSA